MKLSHYMLSAMLSASTLVLGTQGVQAQVVIDDIIPPLEFVFFDEKVMPGNGCHPYIGSQSSDFNHYAPYLLNISTGYRSVSCPVVRDNTTNTTGTWSAAVTAYNPGGTVFCAIYSYDQFGAFVDLGAASTGAVGNITLNLDSVASPLSVSTNDGFYTVYCSLPPSARLYSYRWAERLRTDLNN